MTDARLVRLGAVCRQDRKSIRPGECGDLPYIGLESIEANTGRFQSGELSKTPEIPQANSFRFSREHVLYGKLRPYLNKVALPDFHGKSSTEIIPLLPSEHLDRRYLAYFLRSPLTVSRISERTAGARMPRADMDFILDLPLLLPSRAEQSRIVDVLSRAEGVVRLRRDAQKKATELIPAIFLDMFGDPAENPKEIPARSVSEFVSRFEGGKNLQAGSEGGTYRILKVSAATSGVYRESESKPAPDGYMPPANHVVQAGDLLFSRANTAELVGATALVEHTNGSTLLPDKLWRMVLSDLVEPRYIQALFSTAYVRRELSKLSSGTSASMRNISQAKLWGLKLPIAPLADQRRFAERASQVLSIQTQQAEASDRAEATFATLLASAFDFSMG